MTSDIRIGPFAAIRPAEVVWRCSVSDFIDTCTIRLPLASYVKTVEPVTEVQELMRRDTVPRSTVVGCDFHEGDKVDVRLGYDGDNHRVFRGFVRRINMAETLEMECEGYAWQLRDRYITKSYRTTTARQILKDLVAGTDIKLSDRIDNIPLEKVTLKNAGGLNVLEWFQKECACRVFFDFDTLYVGASQYALQKPEVVLRPGWNTAEDSELKKSVSEDVRINIVEKDSKGKKKKTTAEGRETARYSSAKEVNVRAGLPSDFLRKAVGEMQADENAKGYEGALTLLLDPHVEKGYVCKVKDRRFPERSGSYFVEEVAGTFNTGGGRQKIKLKNYGNVQ